MSENAHHRLNLKTPTLGGLQLWTDELYFHGWHIQRHCFTGHCRLLDERNRRAIVRAQWQLSHALIARYRPRAESA